MSIAKDLLNLMNEEIPISNSSGQDTTGKNPVERTPIDKFFQPSEKEKEQEKAIEKFRRNKQLRYMKKFRNNPDNDKQAVGGSDYKNYYWDVNLQRNAKGF